MYLFISNRGTKSGKTLDIAASYKNVDMLSYLTLLGEDAIMQCRVPLPKRIEGIANGLEISGQIYRKLPLRERLKMAAEMNCNRHV
jgi:hypothetical protein